MNSRNIYQNTQAKGFENIRSKYILRILFDNIKEKKFLEIIKYNKILQTRLEISIKDYAEYAKEHSKIEIELKLVDNTYASFINIPYKKNQYFHIYFNNSNKEMKRTYLKYSEKIKTIKILIDFQIKSLNGLFNSCYGIHSIFFKKFNNYNITDMSEMFYKCSSLKELNLSNFITNNVTNMSEMFGKCSSLKELNLSNCNTNNVTNMSKMFSGCSSLTELNLSKFNTNNVTDMSEMFSECSLLKELNLYNFNTNKVTDMSNIFSRCSEELKNKIKESK